MTTRIAIDFSTDIDFEPWRGGVCDNCHGDHHIQACPQIARFDIETHLREQLATCHEAIGAALALLNQESYNAARIVLDDALKGSGPSALAALRTRIEEIRADYPSDVFPAGGAGAGARMAIERVLALFAIEEQRR